MILKERFMESGEKPENSVLQKFVEPKGNKNSLVNFAFLNCKDMVKI